MKTKLQSVIWSALLTAGLMLALPSVQAQPADGEAGAKPKKERREGGERREAPSVDERLARMRENLGLTDAQVADLKVIFTAEREETQAKMKELGKDAAPEDRRAAMKPIREKYKAQVDAVLTEEQKAKVEKMRQRGPGGPGGEGKGKGEGKGGEKGPKGPPPAQE